jgi:hypothetical protein
MKLTIGIALLAVALPAAALAGQEVRGVVFTPEALKVIDTKCLNCHNRQRIEEAARERKDMGAIVKRMEKKGVSLTVEEEQVMGHFKGKGPFK